MPKLFKLLDAADVVTLNEVEMDVDGQSIYFGSEYPTLARLIHDDEDWFFEDQDVVLKDGSVTAQVFPDPEAILQVPKTVELGLWVTRPMALTDLDQ